MENLGCLTWVGCSSHKSSAPIPVSVQSFVCVQMMAWLPFLLTLFFLTDLYCVSRLPDLISYTASETNYFHHFSTLWFKKLRMVTDTTAKVIWTWMRPTCANQHCCALEGLFEILKWRCSWVGQWQRGVVQQPGNGWHDAVQLVFIQTKSLQEAKHYELLPSLRGFCIPKSNTVNSISEHINLFKCQSSVCVHVCVCVCVRVSVWVCVHVCV